MVSQLLPVVGFSSYQSGLTPGSSLFGPGGTYNSFAGNFGVLGATALGVSANQYAFSAAQLSNQNTGLRNSANVLGSIVGALQGLTSVTQQQITLNSFNALSATSSNSAVVSASAGASPQAGTYSLTVNSLATAQQTLSAKYSSPTTAGQFGAGTLQIKAGASPTVSITVDATTTLQSLSAQINSSVTGVTASVINTGSTYQLQVLSNSTGAANAISFTELTTTLGLATGTVQAAADASFKFGTATQTSASNTLTGLISGVTLQLNSASPTAQTITVGPSATTLTSQINSFVSAYNAAAGALGAAVSGGVATDPFNPLASGITQILGNQLQKAIGTPVTTATGTYKALASIGITSNSDGTLAVNSTQLAAALATDPNSVASLFTSSNGLLSQVNKIATTFGDPATGSLVQEQTGINQLISSNAKRQSTDTYNSRSYASTLQREYASFQVNLSQLSLQSMFFGGSGVGGPFGSLYSGTSPSSSYGTPPPYTTAR
jgi:flagellar hook-associated protein 2